MVILIILVLWEWDGFPGYAIDLETGERLNIIFSEDSWLTSENGNDMMNPTSNIVTSEFPSLDQSTGTAVFSGVAIYLVENTIYM